MPLVWLADRRSMIDNQVVLIEVANENNVPVEILDDNENRAVLPPTGTELAHYFLLNCSIMGNLMPSEWQ